MLAAGVVLAGPAVLLAVIAAPAGAATDPNRPFGNIHLVPNATTRSVHLTGWSIDRNVPASPVTLALSVNGRALPAVRTTGTSTPLNSSQHVTGPHVVDHSWTLGYGTFRVCVTAMNLGAGRVNPVLGCAVVTFRPPASLNDQLAAYARTFVGKARYVEGARGPSSFDCSGLTQYVYGHFGKRIQNTADPQYHQFRAIPRALARPGDLIFFHQGGGAVWHVGIYQGASMMVAAADEAQGIRYQTWTWWSNVSFGTITH
jgi:hypothetical protein